MSVSVFGNVPSCGKVRMNDSNNVQIMGRTIVNEKKRMPSRFDSQELMKTMLSNNDEYKLTEFQKMQLG